MQNKKKNNRISRAQSGHKLLRILSMGPNRRIYSFCRLIFLFAIGFFSSNSKNLYLVCHTFMLFIRCDSAVIRKCHFGLFFVSSPLFQYNEQSFKRIHTSVGSVSINIVLSTEFFNA